MCFCAHMCMCVRKPAEARGKEIYESRAIGDSELPDMGAWIWIQVFCRSSIQLKPWAISPAPVYLLISVVLTLLLCSLYKFLLFNYLSIILHIYTYIHTYIYLFIVLRSCQDLTMAPRDKQVIHFSWFLTVPYSSDLPLVSAHEPLWPPLSLFTNIYWLTIMMGLWLTFNKPGQVSGGGAVAVLQLPGPHSTWQLGLDPSC